MNNLKKKKNVSWILPLFSESEQWTLIKLANLCSYATLLLNKAFIYTVHGVVRM